jgi:uncharacterized protein YndB with AHSA1/START domain
MPATRQSNIIYITRLLNASVAQVWAAWVDEAQVIQWWGPRGFSVTSRGKHVRPGGTWDYTMHGPDGTDYPNLATYHEVIPQALLVYDHGSDGTSPPLFRVRVEFTAVGAQTKMAMQMILPTAEAAQQIRGFVKQAGGNTTWDRLSEYLDKATTGKDRFVINRVFDAPLETMFAMWTEPKHLARWSAPAGATCEFLEVDIRVGGRTHSKMTGPHGTKYGKAEYLEITKPSRIVYVQQFSDEHSNTTRHPMAATWPLSMLTVVELNAETPTMTRVTLTWEPYGDTTAEEVATFVAARGGMSQGWTGSFDALETYAATATAT